MHSLLKLKKYRWLLGLALILMVLAVPIWILLPRVAHRAREA